MTTENNIPKFAMCINNCGYPASLELHKIYIMWPDKDTDKDGDVRITDESGEDYLYPAEWFVTIDLPLKAQDSLLMSCQAVS